MDTYLSHVTALLTLAHLACTDGLRQLSPGGVGEGVPAVSGCTVTDIEENALACLSYHLDCDARRLLPLDVLALGYTPRRRSWCARSHACEAAAVPGSFLHLERHLLVSSPELCFLQMARVLSFHELLRLGMELCGDYWSADNEYGFVGHYGITTAARVSAYLELVPEGVRGVAKARKAARCLIDGARSPMESTVALLLATAGRHGGYGLPAPVLNRRVDLTPEAQAIGRSPYFVVDLLWPDAGYGFEYLGREFHKDVERDLRRELALARDGVVIKPICYEQVREAVQLDEVVRQASARLGYRLRVSGTQLDERRRTLREDLLPHVQSDEDGNLAFERPAWALPSYLTW